MEAPLLAPFDADTEVAVNAQPSLFDPAEGRRRRDAGMARAESKVERWWRIAFTEAVRGLAASGEDFTADDAVALAGLPPGNPNAIGARMAALARQGLIEPTGATRKARRPESHARRQLVWRGKQ